MRQQDYNTVYFVDQSGVYQLDSTNTLAKESKRPLYKVPIFPRKSEPIIGNDGRTLSEQEIEETLRRVSEQALRRTGCLVLTRQSDFHKDLAEKVV